MRVTFVKTTLDRHDGSTRRVGDFIVEGNDREKMKKAFDEIGFCVVPGVLGKEEVGKALQLFWDFMECSSKVKKGSVVVDWEDDDAWPETLEGGILPFYGAGQCSAMWYIRGLASVRECFETFWMSRGDHLTEGLLTSFDAFLIWRTGKVTERGWFHVDQNPREKPGFENVQGLVNLARVTEDTGGNVLIPKSHHLFPQHYLTNERYSKKLDEVAGDDWMEIDGNDSVIFDTRKRENSELCGPVMLELLEGDVLLWDSRIVHCSNSGLQAAGRSGGGGGGGGGGASITRAAALVTMYPKDRVSEEVRRERGRFLSAGCTGSHWANKCKILGEEALGDDDDYKREMNRISSMKETGKGIILDMDDLSRECRDLAV